MVFELRYMFFVMIPIVAIIMGVGVAMLGVWTDYKRKSEMFEMHHKERLLAIERGMEVPPLPMEFFRGASGNLVGSPNDRLRYGLIWLLVGLALMIALALNRSLESAAWGLLPVAVGLANLIYYATVARNQPANPDQQKGS
jgi:hypothetical protein